MAELRVKPDTKVFSPKLFGEKLRATRLEYGFSSVDKFIDAINKKTGVTIDKASMLRIERGQLDPSISRLMAICATLASVSELPQIDELAILSRLLNYAKPLEYLYESNRVIHDEVDKLGISVDDPKYSDQIRELSDAHYGKQILDNSLDHMQLIKLINEQQTIIETTGSKLAALCDLITSKLPDDTN